MNCIKIDMSNNDFDLQFGAFEAYPQHKDVFIVNAWMLTWLIASVVWIYCDILVGGLTFLWGVGCHLLAKHFNDMGADPNSEYF